MTIHEVSLSQFCSIGEIARQLGVEIHRVGYVLRKLNIRPVGKVGGRCLYSQAAVQLIEAELRAIEARKAKQEWTHD